MHTSKTPIKPRFLTVRERRHHKPLTKLERARKWERKRKRKMHRKQLNREAYLEGKRQHEAMQRITRPLFKKVMAQIEALEKDFKNR